MISTVRLGSALYVWVLGRWITRARSKMMATGGTSDALVTVFVMCDQSIYVLKADGDEYALGVPRTAKLGSRNNEEPRAYLHLARGQRHEIIACTEGTGILK